MKLRTWMETQIAAGLCGHSALAEMEKAEAALRVIDLAETIADEIIERNGEDPDSVVILGLAADDLAFADEIEAKAGPGSNTEPAGAFGLRKDGDDWTAPLFNARPHDTNICLLHEQARCGNTVAAELLKGLVAEVMAAKPKGASCKNPPTTTG